MHVPDILWVQGRMIEKAVQQTAADETAGYAMELLIVSSSSFTTSYSLTQM